MDTQTPDDATTGTADILGQQLTTDETELRAIYERLQQLAARDNLAPCLQTNLNQAQAFLWNACNDLGLL